MSKLKLQRGALLLCLAYASAGWAVEAPKSNQLTPKPFEADVLQVSERGSPATALSGQTVRDRVQRSGSPLASAMVDLRTGRFLTLMPATPLIAGSGAGNRLPAQSHESPQALMDAAGNAFRGWLLAHRSELQINPAELVDAPRVTLVGPEYIQIYQSRQIDGVPVRDAAITATIKFGNLMLVGLSDWGSIDEPLRPQIDAKEAMARLAQRIAPLSIGEVWKGPELTYVPVSTDSGGIGSSTAPGLGYRLVHVLRPRFGETLGQYEVLVDAINGEVLSIQDTVHYVASPREVKGGVYPVSGDGAAPDGIEQAQWPMPFARVTTPGGVVTADIGGTLPQCVDGSITSSLSGPFVTINDTCGASSLSGTGNLDFGTSTGTDCVVPASGGGPGNTHAARTGYHELNMITAMARSHLPNNAWLKLPLRADMNIVDTCNAGWNGTFVRFFRSGGGCANTGEQAGVFDHEWGHGLDNNDGVPSVSSPGEGIADIYASLRLDDSCIGRGFRPSLCTGELPGGVYACTGTCTGVRDIDSANHSTGQPFTLANADSCAVPTSGSIGPCGGGVHCEGQVYSQAVWDLWNRDLTGGTFNLNKNVSRELATQLTFKGASGVSSWFACSNGTGGCGNAAGCGCAATSGYQQYLAADDDNGNLADGTPHMSAINAAFARHGIACSTPAVTDSGCSGAPTQLPVVTTTPGDGSVALSWTASAGASSYRVYRTDGVFGCDFGKILVGTVTGTSFLDIGLQNGRSYHYIVVPTGSNSACFKVASSCASSTPAPGAKLNVTGSSAAFTLQSGDGDDFVDNCETAQVTIPVSNNGISALTNVRILSVSSPSHPGTTISTSLPAVVSPSLASCSTSNGQISFVPQGLTAGQTLILDITLTANELAGQNRTVRVQTSATEGSLQLFATKTFTFDTDSDGWVTTQGTFVRDNTGGGAASTTHFLRSSNALNSQCDVTESPVISLAADSTLSLQSNFDIEAFSGNQWWDRAHLTADVVSDGSSTVLSPSGGRTYNATGTGGSCGMGSLPGWGGVASTWAESTFTPAALQTGTLANKLLKLKMRYGTDTADVGTGFKFDQLTVTNVRVQVADSQPDVCGPSPPLLVDGFEGTP